MMAVREDRKRVEEDIECEPQAHPEFKGSGWNMAARWRTGND